MSSKTYGYLVSPNIVEERQLNAVTMTVFDRLLMDRIIFIGTEIDDDVSNIVQAQLLYLSSLNNEDITIYINSPGGSCSAGFGIIDTMLHIKPKVNTVCTGMAASMASLILCVGDTRSILPHARVMIHEPSMGTYGKCTDFLIEANEIEKIRKEMCEIYHKYTKQPIDQLMEDIKHDKYFTAEEAVEEYDTIFWTQDAIITLDGQTVDKLRIGR